MGHVRQSAEQSKSRDKLTLAVDEERRTKLKVYAARRHQTMTHVVSQWIDKYCVEEA